MTSAIYSELRDELVKILGKVIEIKSLRPDKKAGFEAIRKKCMEDQFNIVLVGEFQGGKSTTFNTFCDGREISPRGALVKTSACRLTARHISDPDQNEYATVCWKTGRELILNMEDILSAHIDLRQDLNVVLLPGDELKTLSDVLSFDNSKHLKMMDAAIEKEWEIYQSDKGRYSPETLDVLRIATLILRFAQHEEIQKLRSKALFSIDAISRLIVFPPEWEIKWEKGSQAPFTANDAVFAFIGSIDCYIHSPNLARLGCSITDCPGLFASKWDTQVAIDTIPRSDAVIYLLRGDKAIGTEETKALREIKKMPATHQKLFYAINMKSSRPIIDNSIVPHDVAVIRSIGLPVEDAKIHRYHALLAFLAEFGTLYLNGQSEAASVATFSAMARRMLGSQFPVDQAWTMLANQQLIMSCIPPQTVGHLDSESIEKIRKASGFRSLFDAVEDLIIKNKSESILITNGAEKAVYALTEIGNILKNREDEATENVAQREAELEEAKNKLEEFQREAKKIVEESFKDKIYELLSRDFHDEVILDTTEEISQKIAQKISKKLSIKFGFKMLLKGEAAMNDIVNPIYTEVMNEVIGNRARIWISSIEKGENAAYENSIKPESERIREALEKQWEKLATVDYNFSSLDYPDISEIFSDFVHSSSDKLNARNASGSIFTIGINNLLLSVLILVLSSPLIGIGWIYHQVATLFGQEEEDLNFTEDAEDEARKLTRTEQRIYEQIKAGINAAYGDRETVRDLRSKTFSWLRKIGDLFKAKYTTALEEQANKFQEDHETRKANLKTSLDDRRKVAAEAKAVRETEIMPRDAELKQFIEKTKNFLARHEGK